MKLGVAAASIVFALAVSGASAAPTRVPSSAAATAALGRFLHQLYGEVHGYWTCPGPPINGRVDCLAEVHTGRNWHQLYPSARIRNGVIVFTALTNIAAVTWVRHWWPYSHQWLANRRAPGVASVNSDAFDWSWLALGLAHLKDRARVSRDGIDGDSAGFSRLYLFHCSRRGGLITCRNALGDAMRYRPHPS